MLTEMASCELATELTYGYSAFQRMEKRLVFIKCVNLSILALYRRVASIQINLMFGRENTDGHE